MGCKCLVQSTGAILVLMASGKQDCVNKSGGSHRCPVSIELAKRSKDNSWQCPPQTSHFFKPDLANPPQSSQDLGLYIHPVALCG